MLANVHSAIGAVVAIVALTSRHSARHLNYALANPVEPVQDWRMLMKESLEVDDVRVPVKRQKTLDLAKVEEIARDMLENGQTTPIRVRRADVGYVLIEGYHRLEALKALGESTVEGYVVHARLH